MYHAITKAEIQTIYSLHNDDTEAAHQLLGLQLGSSKQVKVEDLASYVKTGDILVFHSNRGTELGHVALVLDNFETLWIASHWSLPKEKMIRLTPDRLFKISKDDAVKEFSEKVAGYVQDLSDLHSHVSSVLKLNPESFTEKELISFPLSEFPPRKLNAVQELLALAMEKHNGLIEDLHKCGLSSQEHDIMQPLLIAASALLTDFQKAITQFEESPRILGIIYDRIDSFEQKHFLNALDKLEYLVNDTVIVSTKFRPYFQE